jgi:hypothetical protein
VNLPRSPENAGASRSKPKTARPCTVARVVMDRTERSHQAVALRRRSARMRRIDGHRRVAEMVQNPLDDCGQSNKNLFKDLRSSRRVSFQYKKSSFLAQFSMQINRTAPQNQKSSTTVK